MSQPRLLALLAVLALVLAPLPAGARGGGGSGGAGGYGAGHVAQPMGRSNSFGRSNTAGNALRDTARATQNRDPVGRPTDPQVLSAALERDSRGDPVVRSEIIALSPSADALAAAQRLRFTIRNRDDLKALGVFAVTLRAPDGMTATEALGALRVAIPGGIFDYAHVYNPSGAGAPAAYGVSPASRGAEAVRVGMIDGGIATWHRALRWAKIEVRNVVADIRPPPTGHGTAVASLLVGKDGRFSGYLPGARLYAADVFGGMSYGGSAENLAQALNWLAEKNVPVVNISLTGPPNVLLAAAVRGFLKRGHVLVAAAGNDGPAARPNYPAAYPGVVAVTAVDRARHIAPDANRLPSGFAALGVDVRAAHLPEGYAGYSGTSYAAPAVTAGFALLLPRPGVAGAKAAAARLAQTSSRLDSAAPLYLLAPTALAAEAR